jgi:hypothetical protein
MISKDLAIAIGTAYLMSAGDGLLEGQPLAELVEPDCEPVIRLVQASWKISLRWKADPVIHRSSGFCSIYVDSVNGKVITDFIADVDEA